MDRLDHPAEMEVLRQLASWPKLVISAANARTAPRRLFPDGSGGGLPCVVDGGREAPELRFIREDDAALTAARLRLVKATALLIRSGLGVLAIEAREEM